MYRPAGRGDHFLNADNIFFGCTPNRRHLAQCGCKKAVSPAFRQSHITREDGRDCAEWPQASLVHGAAHARRHPSCRPTNAWAASDRRRGHAHTSLVRRDRHNRSPAFSDAPAISGFGNMNRVYTAEGSSSSQGKAPASTACDSAQAYPRARRAVDSDKQHPRRHPGRRARAPEISCQT